MSKPLRPDHLFESLRASGSSTGVAGGASEKGIARVRLSNGTVRLAEVHWYEAHGIGRKELKIKRYID